MNPYDYGLWTKLRLGNETSWHKGNYLLTMPIGQLARMRIIPSHLDSYWVYQDGRIIATNSWKIPPIKNPISPDVLSRTRTSLVK